MFVKNNSIRIKWVGTVEITTTSVHESFHIQACWWLLCQCVVKFANANIAICLLSKIGIHWHLQPNTSMSNKKEKKKLEQKTDKHRKKNSTWKANSTWVYFDHKRRNFLQTPESHSHGKKLAVQLLKKSPEKNQIRDGGNEVTWVRILFRHLEKILGLY